MAAPDIGRRERNKQEKLERITRAAQELFATRGVSEVTTQQVSQRADVAAGTLFLYARNKGELLLLAHNSSYAEALERGESTAAATDDVESAVMAIISEIVACNRAQVENGRAYLREMVFGDPTEPHHAAALGLSRRTEEAVAACLARDLDPASAATAAHVITAIMLLAMASPLSVGATADELVRDMGPQVHAVIGRHA